MDFMMQLCILNWLYLLSDNSYITRSQQRAFFYRLLQKTLREGGGYQHPCCVTDLCFDPDP